jgi:hypothetical protein
VLVAIDTPERACQLGDEDGDGIMFWVQGSGGWVLGVKVEIKNME